MRPCQYLIMIPGRVLRYRDRFVCIPLWSLVSVGSVSGVDSVGGVGSVGSVGVGNYNDDNHP